MKRLWLSLVLGWFVTTISGEAVAGPFILLQDCQRVAEVMAKQSPFISQVCQARAD
jgi:hypothetical protein